MELLEDDLLEAARGLLPGVVDLRRDLHRHPELGLELPRTQAAVLDALDGLGLEVTTGESLGSVVADLEGGRPGPRILLRGDMDALPMPEDTGLEFASEVDGAMHACGHDLHVAGLVGAARLLAARRDELPGTVVLMFQPAEETDGGARTMIEEGVLDAAGERVVAAYGVHVFSAAMPLGTVTARPGTAMAASDHLYVTVHGRGGHGSTPHLAADPVTVAAEIVLAFQTAVTRQFDAHDPVVVSVGRIAAGTVDNVIPATAEIDATVRTFSRAHHASVPERLATVAEHVAAAHGLTAEVRYVRGYPVTVNDPAETERARAVTTAVLGADAWEHLDRPLAGAEDFSFVLEEVPGAFVFLGATPPDLDPAEAPYNHSPHARFADDAVPTAAALLAGFALDRLATR